MDDILKEGAVSVRSHFLWRERFVVVKKGQVLIFRRRDGSVKTKIDLLHASVKLTFHSENSYITIAHAHGKDCILDCHTTRARDAWLSALFTARGRLEADTESDLILSGDDSDDDNEVDTITTPILATDPTQSTQRDRTVARDDDSDASGNGEDAFDNENRNDNEDDEYSDALLAFQDVRSSMMQCHLAMSMAKDDLFVAPDASVQSKHHHIHATQSEEAARLKCIQALVAYIESSAHGGRVVLLHLGVLASAGISVDDLLLALGEKQKETPRRASLTSTTISMHKLNVATFVRDMLFHAVYSKRPEVQTAHVNALIDRFFSHCRLRRFSHDDDQMAMMSVHPLGLDLAGAKALMLGGNTVVSAPTSAMRKALPPPRAAAMTMSKAEMMLKKKRHSFPNLLTPLRARAGLLDATKLEDLLRTGGSNATKTHVTSAATPASASAQSASAAVRELRTAVNSSAPSSSTASLPAQDSSLFHDDCTPEPLRSLLWRNSCVEVAEQFTVFHHAQLARLRLWDVLHHPREAAKEISESFNRLVAYFVWSVLLEDTPKDRAEAIEDIISIALAASSVTLNNFHLVMACVGCLGDTPLMVSRLPATWKRVRPKFKTHLRELRTLCDHTGGFENLRKRQTLMSAKCACVPFIGVIGVALERLRATTYFTDRTKALDMDKLERQYAALHVLENSIQRPYKSLSAMPQLHAFLTNLSMDFATSRLLQLRSQQILSHERAGGSSSSNGGSGGSRHATSFLQAAAGATASSSSLSDASECSTAAASPSFLSFAHICTTLVAVPVVRERVEICLEALFTDDKQYLTRQLRRFWLEFKANVSITACHFAVQSVRACIDALTRDVLATKMTELQQISGLDENAQELHRIVYDAVVRTVTQPIHTWLFAKVKHTFHSEDAKIFAFAARASECDDDHRSSDQHAPLQHQQQSFRSIRAMHHTGHVSSPMDLAMWLADCVEAEAVRQRASISATARDRVSPTDLNAQIPASVRSASASTSGAATAAHSLLARLGSDNAHLFSALYVLQQLLDTALLSARLRDAIAALELAVTQAQVANGGAQEECGQDAQVEH